MKVLFDQNVPRPLARFLSRHKVTRVAELSWQELTNGDLIAAAEAKDFDLLVTADKNLRYQQNLTGRRLAIVVLPSGRWPAIQQMLAAVVEAVDAAAPGTYTEVGGLM